MTKIVTVIRLSSENNGQFTIGELLEVSEEGGLFYYESKKGRILREHCLPLDTKVLSGIDKFPDRQSRPM